MHLGDGNTIEPKADYKSVQFRKKEMEHRDKEKMMASKEIGKCEGKSKDMLALKINTNNNDYFERK